MATNAEIAGLRLLIAEEDETKYTDQNLSDRLDAADAPSETRVAWEIWTEKAAALTALVDISEGGSSRSMNALQDKALKMVALFKQRLDDAITEPTVITGTRLHRLKR
jgi:hypothetical protein